MRLYLSDAQSLLLHNLMQNASGGFIHLIEFVNATNAIICRIIVTTRKLKNHGLFASNLGGMIA